MARKSWFVGRTLHGVKRNWFYGKTESLGSNSASLTSHALVTGVNTTDPDQEREPPPPPTPVTFPTHDERRATVWDSRRPPPTLESLFSKVSKPSDITSQHIEALNISILPACPVTDLLPLAADGGSYLPPFIEFGNPYTEEAEARMGYRRRDVDDRLAELRTKNDTAFRTINRTLPKGARVERLAHMRKFFEGLEWMSSYWDCSLDQYYDGNEHDDGGEHYAKRQRLESDSPAVMDPYTSSCMAQRTCIPAQAIKCHDGSNQMVRRHERDRKGLEHCSADNANAASSSNGQTVFDPAPIQISPTRMRYKGRRTSTGHAMPDVYRSDTARAFVEGTVWPFRTTVSPPRTVPFVQIGKLKVPVRQTAAVYRMPTDRTKGRQGWLEGPLLSLQARPETDFQGGDVQQNEAKARLDLTREIGALLQTAQERRREGRTEVRPGEGKWWTTKPRWGGGPGGEVENEIGNSDIVAVAAEILDSGKTQTGQKAVDAREGRKRKMPALLWKELKRGRSLWDPKTNYAAIGKDPNSQRDEVRIHPEST